MSPRAGTYEQLDFLMMAAEKETADWAASSIKTVEALVAGDYIEVRDDHSGDWAGWLALRHPVDGAWQVQVAGGADRDSLGFWYRHLPRHSAHWRCVRHDPEWTLGPSPDEVVAWMRDAASRLPHARWHELYHTAMAAWPVGVEEAWRTAVQDTFTALAIKQVPVREHLRERRKASGAGTRIWACPEPICRAIENEIWPLPGAERWPAIFALRWTRAQHFGGLTVPAPDNLLAFNAHSVSIYGGYLRWAVEHAASPRQLLELLNNWGSNPAPRDEQPKEVAP